MKQATTLLLGLALSFLAGCGNTLPGATESSADRVLRLCPSSMGEPDDMRSFELMLIAARDEGLTELEAMSMFTQLCLGMTSVVSLETCTGCMIAIVAHVYR